MTSDVRVHRKRTVASGVAAFVARSLQGALSLATAVVMARLLVPGDFGVFAMVVPLGVLATNAANSATQAAFLQHPLTEDSQLQAYHAFVRRVAAGSAIVMGLLGFVVAWVYDESRVIAVTLAWALVVGGMSRAAMQEALLKRDLRFPIVYGVQLLTWFFGLAVGLVAAWQGMGYWSLPLQVITMEVSRIAAMNIVSPWRPHRGGVSDDFALARLRRGWLSLFGLRVSSWINEQPELVAVGRLGGSVVLGTYDTARRWAWYSFEEPYLALTEVAIASLGSIRDDPPRFRHLVLRSVLAMLTASLPVIAFVSVEAATVVHVLLGDKWVSAGPFLRLLGIAAFAGAIVRTARWILLSHGGNDRLLRWSLWYQAPATVVATLIGLRWGAIGVAWAMMILAVGLVLPAIAYSVHGTPVSLTDVLRAASRPALASVVGALILVLVSSALPAAPGIMRLGAALGVYLPTFALAWLVMPHGIRDTRALIDTVRELGARRQA